MLTYPEAEKILDQLRSATGQELVHNVVACAVRYARLRTDWRLMTPEEQREADAGRTAAHNALIDACNALSRHMAKQGEPTEWRRILGDDRRIIGDFACHLHARLGLEAR